MGCSSSGDQLREQEAPIFLSVRSGDYVLIEESFEMVGQEANDYWIGQIIHCTGCARDPTIPSLLQIINIDTGIIKIVNGNLIKGILKRKNND